MSKNKLKINRENGLENLDFGTKTVEADKSVVILDKEKGLDRGLVRVEVQLLKPAPPEWNFFSKLTLDEYSELKENIRNNGLSHPAVVYLRKNGEYMIISGHNRINIYKELAEEDPYKYRTIPCIVETPDSLDELDIREKIIDLNILNRKLSRMDISRSIYHKWMIQKQRKRHGEGLTTEMISKELDISVRHISRYKSLFYLIEPLQNLVENEEISVENGSKLAAFDKELQTWIYENFSDKLTHNNLKRIHSAMEKKELANIFTVNLLRTTSFKYNIPTEYKKEFDSYVSKWLLEKGINPIRTSVKTSEEIN